MALRGPNPTPDVRPGVPLTACDEALRVELSRLLDRQDQLWQALDFAALSGLWDAAEGRPVYIGDEYPAPIVGWQDLARHWAKLGGRLHSALMRSTLFEARRLTDDIAVAVFLAEWQLVAVESPERHTGQRWVTAVLRRRDGAWRIVHHAESPAYVNAAEIATDAG